MFTMADEKQKTLFGGDDPEEQETELTAEDVGEGEPEPEACGPEDGCKEPEKSGNEKKSKSSSSAKSSASAPGPTGYTAPFFIRYAAEVLDLEGFVDGQTYTKDQIKRVLINNGYTEFQEMDIDLHHAVAANTLVITIKGSRKGGGHGRQG